MNVPEPRVSRLWNWAAIGLALAGFIARCLPGRFVFAGDTPVLPWVDPYYHLWRADLLLRDFANGLFFDRFIAFPRGAPIPWPPGFDLLVALPGWLTGTAPLRMAAFLPPMLGGLAVYLTYRLGRRAFDPAIGLLAAFLQAFMLGAIHFSSLGRIDHHALIAPVSLGMMLSLLAGLRSENRMRCIAWCGLSAALAAVSVASWIVTPALYFLPLPLSLAWLSLRKKTSPTRCPSLSLGLFSGFLVTGVVVLFSDLTSRPFVLYQPSWFTVLIFALACGFAILAAFRPRLAFVLAGVSGMALAGGLWLAPDALGPLAQAIRVAAGGDSSYTIASESGGLFFENGVLTVRKAVQFYSHLVLLWPLLLGALMAWSQKMPARPERVLVIVFALTGCTTLTLQHRFGEYATPALALLFAWGILTLLRLLKPSAGQHASRVRALCVLLLLALAGALAPLVEGLVFLASEDPTRAQRVLIQAAGQLARFTPEPGNPPAYGVLTSWMDATPVLYTARRPVVASSFATPETAAANRQAFQWLLSPDEERTARELLQRRVRYVLVSEAIQQMNPMARMAGFDFDLIGSSLGWLNGQAVRRYHPRPAFFASLHTRLLLADGNGAFDQPALDHFRLLWESPERAALFDVDFNRVKVFEVVPGAVLVGRAAPGTSIGLRLGLESNTGRQWTYERVSRADAAGRYAFTVPYATGNSTTPTRAVTAYRIKTPTGLIRLEVPESAIQGGQSLDLPSAD